MFKKLNSSNVQTSAVQIGSGVAGAATSEGVITLVTEQIDPKHETLARGVVTVASTLAAASVKGKNLKAEALKFLFVGMAIKQGARLLKNLAPLVGVSEPSETDSTADKALKATLGLGCGTCQEKATYYQQPLMLPTRQPETLNAAVGFPTNEEIYNESNVMTQFD